MAQFYTEPKSVTQIVNTASIQFYKKKSEKIKRDIFIDDLALTQPPIHSKENCGVKFNTCRIDRGPHHLMFDVFTPTKLRNSTPYGGSYGVIICTQELT